MYVTSPVCMLLMSLHPLSFCSSFMMFVRTVCNAQMHEAPVPVIQTAWPILLCSSNVALGVLQSGKTNAERLLDRYHNEWGQTVDPIYQQDFTY